MVLGCEKNYKQSCQTQLVSQKKCKNLVTLFEAGERVEVQIYRIKRLGELNTETNR